MHWRLENRDELRAVDESARDELEDEDVLEDRDEIWRMELNWILD